MGLSNEDQDEIRRASQAIFLAYTAYLEEERLKDTHLTRMSYFSAVKKRYLEEPMASIEMQKTMIAHLDRWMSEAQKTMNDAMPEVPEWLRLHISRRET